MISEIILKLMAKNAEDRYQTAAGLQADLEACQQARQVSSQITPFSLGRADISNQFQTPQRLYGREAEIETLLAAFERASQATGELMLIAGSPGIGKTALVQEIYRPLTRHEGYFIAGKFDQFQRTTPYASLIQAFQALIRQLLTESGTKIENWRQAMKEALGMNGRAISEVIPDLELILGPQPPLPELPPVEAQNRFNLTFQNFIQVFTRPEHPLILFLDDLQWADSASLQLLQRLIGPTEPQHLFIIGTYRENEVDEAHPLQQSMAAIRENGGHVNQIFLKPLDFDQIRAFVADALGAPSAQAESLAQLVAAKTNGNPFFMNEFLKALYREDLLRPTQRTAEDDHSRGTVRWQWDIAELQARDITDNVV
jgi:predicted ATPase